MKDIFIKWFMALNTFLIRISNGRIGSKLGTQTILLLHTVGRKSGKQYETPIAYFFHEGQYLMVASNWGKVGEGQAGRLVLELKGKSTHDNRSKGEDNSCRSTGSAGR